MTRTHSYLAALLAVVFAAYSLGFSGPLLFDDYSALSGNRLLQFDAAVFDQWRTASKSSRAGILGRSVSMFTFAANAAAAGEVSVFWIKLTNALIHISIGVLFYLLAAKLFARVYKQWHAKHVRWLALLAAGIWLLHPLNVSTVLYAVQRMAQLPTLFVCAGLVIFLHYRQRWADAGANTGEVIAAGLWLSLVTLLAAFSKENGALLPLLILVVEVCFFGGEWAGRRVAALRWLASGTLFLFFALLLLCVFFPPELLEIRYTRREFTLHERVLTQARMLWHYVSWIAVPNISAMGFQHDDIAISKGLLQPFSTLVAVVAWCATLIVAIVLRQRYPLLLFAVLFFLVGHSVESSVWPLEMVYEHRNYMPGLAVCMLLAAILTAPFSRGDNGRLAGTLLVICLPLVLLFLLVVRVDSWSDGLRLTGVNAKNHPNSSRSNYFYANALLGRFQRAEAEGLSEAESREALLGARYYFERTHETNPRDVTALVMLHSIDMQYFSQMPDRTDWLSRLENLLKTRALQSSDKNALDAFLICVNAGGCDADDHRIIAMLDGLESRYPRNLTVLGWRYTYLLGQNASVEELGELIDRALSIDPGRREYLIRRIQQQAKVNDVDGMYESMGAWLKYDSPRHFLHVIKSMFTTDESTGRSD